MWMENLGIKVEMQGLEWKIYLITLDIDRPHMFRAGWAADYPDPHNFMNIFTCNGGNNETGWCDNQSTDLRSLTTLPGIGAAILSIPDVFSLPALSLCDGIS